MYQTSIFMGSDAINQFSIFSICTIHSCLFHNSFFENFVHALGDPKILSRIFRFSISASVILFLLFRLYFLSSILSLQSSSFGSRPQFTFSLYFFAVFNFSLRVYFFFSFLFNSLFPIFLIVIIFITLILLLTLLLK